MSAHVLSVTEKSVTIQVTVEFQSSMLSSEDAIQQGLNEAGCLMTTEALKKYDTDGAKLLRGGESYTSKGQLPKRYQSPYGEIQLKRHVYQSPKGGKTYCPLEENARVIITATPRFAQQVSHKLAQSSSPDVKQDFQLNHGRLIARSYLQNLAEAVGAIAQAKEEDWSYEVPELPVSIETISIGLDGSCLLLCEEGWREAMVGTVSLYDQKGERHHTIYLGATPEYGKGKFIQRFEKAILQIKTLYPDAFYIGLADGAQSNWSFLGLHTDLQILDFYHAVGYLKPLAEAMYPRNIAQQTQYLDQCAHQLKHEHQGAEQLYHQMLKANQKKRLSKTIRLNLEAAITYFENHLSQMDYAAYRLHHYPIGSGITEAACKTLIKQRLCNAGMRWKDRGASIILSLRALVLSPTHWQQFWQMIEQQPLTLGHIN